MAMTMTDLNWVEVPALEKMPAAREGMVWYQDRSEIAPKLSESQMVTVEVNREMARRMAQGCRAEVKI